MNNFKNGFSGAKKIHFYFQNKVLKTHQLIITAFLASMAALFQSAGGFFPGVGYLISPLSTAPIIFCTFLSIRQGFLGYVLAIFILFILQPSEVFVFPFTTGLLGLVIGTTFLYLQKRIYIIETASLCLFAGINLLLYGLRFPVLGPRYLHRFIFFLSSSYTFSLFCIVGYGLKLQMFLLKKCKKFFNEHAGDKKPH